LGDDMPQRLDLDDNLIIRLYEDGKSGREIGEHFGVARDTIIKRLKENKIKIRFSSPLIKLNEEKIIYLYNSGKSSIEIGSLLHCSPSGVLGVLRRNRIKIRLSTSGLSLGLDEDKIIQLYKSGKTGCSIANVFMCSYATIYNILKRNGLKKRCKKTANIKTKFDSEGYPIVDGYIYED
jgi:DNA-binding CsgD family transcriptional regulator